MKCQCNSCVKERKFEEIISKLESDEDKKFMKDYQNYYINESFDKDIAEAKEESLIEILKTLKFSGIFSKQHYDGIFSGMKNMKKSLLLPENFWEIL